MDFITPPSLDDGGYGYALFMLALIVLASVLTVYALRKATREREQLEQKEAVTGKKARNDQTGAHSDMATQNQITEHRRTDVKTGREGPANE